jgi:hypothetical protein
MRRTAFDHPFAEPEKDEPVVTPKALKVRVTRGTILPLKIHALGDPERQQSPLIEGGSSEQDR